MNFMSGIHLMSWNYLIALIDMITRSRNKNRNSRNNSIHCNNRGGRAPPLLFPSPLLLLFLLFLFLLCVIRSIR